MNRGDLVEYKTGQGYYRPARFVRHVQRGHRKGWAVLERGGTYEPVERITVRPGDVRARGSR